MFISSQEVLLAHKKHTQKGERSNALNLVVLYKRRQLKGQGMLIHHKPYP